MTATLWFGCVFVAYGPGLVSFHDQLLLQSSPLSLLSCLISLIFFAGRVSDAGFAQIAAHSSHCLSVRALSLVYLLTTDKYMLGLQSVLLAVSDNDSLHILVHNSSAQIDLWLLRTCGRNDPRDC